MGPSILFGATTDLLRRIDSAKNIRNVSEADDFGSLGQKLVENIQPQAALIVHVNIADSCASLLGSALPGEHAGSVLSESQDHLVTRSKMNQPPCRSHYIERFGGASRPDNFKWV
jgi:hypothetical protein